MRHLSTSTTIAKAQTKAGKHGWDASAVRSEMDAKAVIDAGCWFDVQPAARVVKFFDRVLRHVDTATGMVGPFVLLPWQEGQFIRPLFGWRREDGTRRYRRAGVWVPKKNGKSTLAAGLELYMLVGDDEPAAEVYSAANDRKQAGIIHGHAVSMIEQSPKLMTRITKKGIIRSTKTIYDRISGSSFMALSADAPTKEGLNIHALFVDEIHAMKNRVLWDTLVYGGASRRQPLIVSISTAGVYDVGTIGWEQYTYAKNILNGTNESDWSFLPLIFEAPADADWTSEETHRLANPSYGKTVNPSTMAEECREAQSEPRKESAFRRYRLNQWTQQLTRWIPLDAWDANNVHPLNRSELKGSLAFLGLDLGSVSDMTALAIVVECPHDPDALDVFFRFWVPESTANDTKNRNYVLYQEWMKAGLLETTPGDSTDYDFIEAAVISEAQHFNVAQVAIDRLFQGQQVANHLGDEGLTVVAVGQGFLGQGGPMKEFERRWRGKRIHHGGHAIARWNADNVEVKQDPAGNLKIVKPNHHNDPRKVDGIAALVNALDPVTRQVSEQVAPDPVVVMW